MLTTLLLASILTSETVAYVPKLGTLPTDQGWTKVDTSPIAAEIMSSSSTNFYNNEFQSASTLNFNTIYRTDPDPASEDERLKSHFRYWQKNDFEFNFEDGVVMSIDVRHFEASEHTNGSPGIAFTLIDEDAQYLSVSLFQTGGTHTAPTGAKVRLLSDPFDFLANSAHNTSTFTKLTLVTFDGEIWLFGEEHSGSLTCLYGPTGSGGIQPVVGDPVNVVNANRIWWGDGSSGAGGWVHLRELYITKDVAAVPPSVMAYLESHSATFNDWKQKRRAAK